MSTFQILPPPTCKGMTVLDTEAFRTVTPVVAVMIKNPRMLSKLSKECPPNDLLQVTKFPTVFDENGKRFLVLSTRFKEISDTANGLDPKTYELLEEAGYEFFKTEIVTTYKYWTSEEVLRAVLPDDLSDVPNSFSMVGHIAHLNLRDQFLPYKHLIGQVIIDKNPSIKTVVRKLDSINTTFRTFDMEVIAGEELFEVEQAESGCRFQFDFRKVYWNSRLHTEHERLVKLFGKGKAICDPFSGVGPFAIPAAKHDNLVFASDLNPESYKAMVKNSKLNKVNPEMLHCYNEDAREFIKTSIKKLHELRKQTPTIVLPPKGKSKKKNVEQPQKFDVPEYYSHYVMNLPASAIEFLDAFRGIYKDVQFTSPPPQPLAHVHCFHKFDPHLPEPTKGEVYEAICSRISDSMGYKISPSDLTLHDVRRVAPSKDMYEASFLVPNAVLYDEV